MRIPVYVKCSVDEKNEIFIPKFIHYKPSRLNMVTPKKGEGIIFGYRKEEWDEDVIRFTTGILIHTEDGIIRESRLEKFDSPIKIKVGYILKFRRY